FEPGRSRSGTLWRFRVYAHPCCASMKGADPWRCATNSTAISTARMLLGSLKAGRASLTSSPLPSASASGWRLRTAAFRRAVRDTIYDILALVSSADVIRALKRDGWSEARVKGSHHHFKHPTKPGIVTVPHPKKDIPRGTLASIERQAGIQLR